MDAAAAALSHIHTAEHRRRLELCVHGLILTPSGCELIDCKRHHLLLGSVTTTDTASTLSLSRLLSLDLSPLPRPHPPPLAVCTVFCWLGVFAWCRWQHEKQCEAQPCSGIRAAAAARRRPEAATDLEARPCWCARFTVPNSHNCVHCQYLTVARCSSRRKCTHTGNSVAAVHA